MYPSDRVRLRHMLDAAGEAASKVTAGTRDGFPELPWADIVSMRNRLIHAYFDLDIDRVYDTITLDLPPLITILKRIVADQE